MEAKNTTALTSALDQPGATPATVAALWRQATDVAGACSAIVKQCVIEIVDRRYVKVEGWMSIAVAHGCIASIKSVAKIEGEGVEAWAEIRRISDQVVLATAEGFVGMDEPDWYGGEVTRVAKKGPNRGQEITFRVPKRPEHAIRAMAQTRAISRVLRAGFSHVVVLIDAKLQTVPYEEIAGTEDHDDDDRDRPTRPERTDTSGGAGGTGTAARGEVNPAGGQTAGATPETGGGAGGTVEVPREPWIQLRDQYRERKWEKVAIHFGQKSKGKLLGELTEKSLAWWITDWIPQPFKGAISDEDIHLRAALDVAGEETAAEKGSR